MRRFQQFMFIIACLISTAAFSQSFFFSSPKKPNAGPPAKTNGVTANPVVSPEDFKSKVSTLSQQTKTGLSQKATQELKKPINITTPPPITETPAGAASTGGSTIPALSPTNPPPPPISVTKPPPATPPIVSAPSTPPPPVPTMPLTPQKPAETYTGFGGGNKNGNTPTEQPKENSSGWNINY